MGSFIGSVVIDTDMHPTAPSFLVINVARIGDTLFATPSIHALATHYPGSRIDALAHPRRAEVLKNLPFITRVGAITKKTAPFRGWLQSKRYDYAIVYGFDEALVRYALRVAHRTIAFEQKTLSLNTHLYRMVKPPAFQAAHAIVSLMQLPASINVVPAGHRICYSATEKEIAWARAKLATDVPSGSHPLIGLQVASFFTKAYRDWPIESFANLAELISQKWPNAHFLIYGGKAEAQRTAWLGEALGARATVYAGRLTLRETAAIMSRTQLYVGVDTGPTHIMSAFDVPLVGLYHCYSPSRLIGALDHPCFFPVDHPRPYGCAVDVPMAEISVDMVLAAVGRALATQPARAATP